MSEDELSEALPVLTKYTAIVATADLIPSKSIRDKINNVIQKEDALALSGVTRYKMCLRIAEALDATKWSDEVDSQGNVKRVLIPDAPRRQWGVEQAAKLFGDYVTHVDTNLKVIHSVEELLNVYEKARLK